MGSIIAGILKRNIVEHLLFLVLGILAVVFSEERLYADSSYYIYQVINKENFCIEHHRYILVLSQVIPLLAIKIGFNLKAVLLLYSIGHVVFFYSIFLITKYYYQDEQSGILLLLIQTLGIMSGFFVPMFELYYSAGLLVLFTCILYHSHTYKALIVLIALAFFILTAHAYSFILFLFILVLHALEFKLKYLRIYLLFSAVMMGIFIFKTYTASDYDQGKTKAFLYVLKNGAYNFQYLKSLCAFLWKYYREILMIESALLIVLIFSRDFIKALVIALFFFCTLAIINISYYGFEHTRYQEQVYFPLSFIAAVPFLDYIVKIKERVFRMVISFVAFLIIILRIHGIWNESKIFVQRTGEMKSIIENARSRKGSKFIVNEKLLKFPSNWSYPIETMLLSSYESNKRTITICTEEDMNFNQNRSKLSASNFLFRRWEVYTIQSLNIKYFSLESGDYIMLQ